MKVKLPVLQPPVAERTRAELGLPDGFLFLYVHDYHSVAARKNPIGLIEAYCRAFPEPGETRLVLKSINADTRPQEHERVRAAAAGRDDIELVDAYVSGAEKNAIIAACDAYVSLHRSEGFGLTPAEAMLLEKPVIATAYGGTEEFMTDANSYRVRWSPAPVGEGAYPYAPRALWAEPDLDHAAELMRRVHDDPADARARGALARQDMLARHSPAAAGESLKARLEVVHEHLAAAGVRSLNLPHLPAPNEHDHLMELIANPPYVKHGGDRRDRMRWRVVGPVAEWARAYVEHQRDIDAEVHAAIVRVEARLEEVLRTLHEQQGAQHAETLATLRRLELELRDARGHSSV